MEVLIEEYSKTDNGAGMRGPLILVVERNKISNNLNILWHIKPGEGSNYDKSIKKIFSPKSVDIIFPKRANGNGGEKAMIDEIDEKNRLDIEKQKKEYLLKS